MDHLDPYANSRVHCKIMHSRVNREAGSEEKAKGCLWVLYESSGINRPNLLIQGAGSNNVQNLNGSN